MHRGAVFVCALVLLGTGPWTDYSWPEDSRWPDWPWPSGDFSGGTPDPANILWGMYDYEVTQACSSESGVTATTGTPECDCSLPDCPLSGSESVTLNAIGTAETITWGSAFTAEGSIAVADFLLNVVTYTILVQQSIFRLQDGVTDAGSVQMVGFGSPLFRTWIGCKTPTGGAGSASVVIQAAEDYRIRAAFGYDGAGCTAIGVTDPEGTGDCCRVWMDKVSDGEDWGTTSIMSLDSSGSPGTIDQVGIGPEAANTTWLIMDDMAVCNEMPPAGTRCGDL